MIGEALDARVSPLYSVNRPLQFEYGCPQPNLLLDPRISVANY